jgi:hypothetical protein
MANRMSLRCLTAALVAGLALSLTPMAPVLAADGPGVQAPRALITAPRVRAPVRAVARVRPPVVCYDFVGRPFDCRAVAPGYYTYGGCCPVALPYYWAVRYARYRYAHGCCYY